MAQIAVYEIHSEATAAEVLLASFETGKQAQEFMRGYTATRPNSHTTAKIVSGSREVPMFSVRGR